MPVQKIKSGRVLSPGVGQFIGEHGTIFYDEALGDLRLSDGVTPGGIPLLLGGTSTYVLVPATTSTLGGVIIGDGLTISNSGTISVSNVVSNAGPYIRVTSDTTATVNTNYIADTSGGEFTLTLPAAPVIGDHVYIADGNDWFATNLIVAANGSLIEGMATDLVLTVKGIEIYCVYNGPTNGWQIAGTAGGYDSGSSTGGSPLTVNTYTNVASIVFDSGFVVSSTSSGSISVQSVMSSNIDGGSPSTVYGGVPVLDAGGV